MQRHQYRIVGWLLLSPGRYSGRRQKRPETEDQAGPAFTNLGSIDRGDATQPYR